MAARMAPRLPFVRRLRLRLWTWLVAARLACLGTLAPSTLHFPRCRGVAKRLVAGLEQTWPWLGPRLCVVVIGISALVLSTSRLAMSACDPGTAEGVPAEGEGVAEYPAQCGHHAWYSATTTASSGELRRADQAAGQATGHRCALRALKGGSEQGGVAAANLI